MPGNKPGVKPGVKPGNRPGIKKPGLSRVFYLGLSSAP